MGYNPYYDEDDERRPSTQQRFLGILLIMVSAVGGGFAILTGSSIMGTFFSYFLPLTAGLPAGNVAVINSIPTYVFLGFDIFIGSLCVSIVAGVLHFIFRVF